MSHPSLDPRLVADLRSTISGTVAYRGDRAYDRLLAGHNLAVRHRPHVVVEAASSTDVSAAVRVAVDHGLPVTVHATGHGAPHGVEDGVVVSTRRLDSVSIDADALTATVGAGAVWGAVVAAAETHGLVPVSTNGPSVGVVGSVLGGGIGPLSRGHGFAAQHVRRLTVVTADGFERTVTPEEDLGWALLGGRDGIGVVTSVVLDLLPAPALWGGEAVFVEDLGGGSSTSGASARMPHRRRRRRRLRSHVCRTSTTSRRRCADATSSGSSSRRPIRRRPRRSCRRSSARGRRSTPGSDH